MTHSQTTRQSSIELLRIIAIVLILAHHFVTHNVDNMIPMEHSLRRSVILLFEYVPGKIGIALFFIISAWFLAKKSASLRSCIHKIWMLELELLFWGIVGIIAEVIISPATVTDQTYLNGIFPLTRGTWWYASAYALFLLFLPFVLDGLRNLGKHRHKQLCIIMIGAWGFLSFVPGAALDIGLNVIGFYYVFTLITYYRWYMNPISVRSAAVILAISLALIIAWNLCMEQIWHDPTDGSMASYVLVVDREWSLPVLAASFSLFVLCNAWDMHSLVINKVAAAAFGVYLITDQPFARVMLWQKVFPLEMVYSHATWLLRFVLIVAVVFIVATLVELLRKQAFSHIDLWWAGLFNRLWRLALSLDAKNSKQKSNVRPLS